MLILYVIANTYAPNALQVTLRGSFVKYSPFQCDGAIRGTCFNMDALLNTPAAFCSFSVENFQLVSKPHLVSYGSSYTRHVFLQNLFCVLGAGTYCRLQPLQADFHQDVRENVREVLEAALFTHSTLTEGDWISVDFGGRAYDLRVQQLEPAPQVSVIGECMP